MISSLFVISVLTATAGGLVRGLTGFGGSLVMTPLLTLYFEPRLVVPTVLLLEAFAAAPALIDAARLAHFRTLVPICAASFLTVPLGSLVLLHADPTLLRRGIAAMVLTFSLLLLKGVRYHGPRPMALSVGLGLVCGVLLGSTGIGAPPIILYLMAGPDPLPVTRANLTLCVAAISVAALLVLWLQHALVLDGPLPALAMAPCFLGGTVLGARLFRRFSEIGFRRLALLLLMAVAALALLR